MVNAKPRPLYPWERDPVRLVGSSFGLDGYLEEKIYCPGLFVRSIELPEIILRAFPYLK